MKKTIEIFSIAVMVVIVVLLILASVKIERRADVVPTNPVAEIPKYPCNDGKCP